MRACARMYGAGTRKSPFDISIIISYIHKKINLSSTIFDRIRGIFADVTPSDADVFSVQQVRTVWNAPVEIGGVEYTDMGDITNKPIDLSSAPADNRYYQAGAGHVLWDGADKTVTLHDALITAFYTPEIPAGARGVVEGGNTLTATNTYALVCYSGGITVEEPDSLRTVSQLKNSTGWMVAVYASGAIFPS